LSDRDSNGNTVPVPCHIGIIMDGNGRWARQKGQLRTQGHLEGLKAAKRIVKAASDMGISYLTLYTFSTENWKRAREEVSFIMGLVRQYLRGELDFYRQNRIRIRHTGDTSGLPEDIQKELENAGNDTRLFDGMQVVLALNYGGRDEIVRGIRKLLDAPLPEGKPLTEADFRRYLDNPDIPDPDLIIRSAGEWRTSNFLLWGGAYAEYYVSEKLWPDWTGEDLQAAVSLFTRRDRRYGGVTSA
jgi:undecaprenyl diphosphate synthase